MNELLPVGTKVKHLIRGAGVIIAHNQHTIIDSVYKGYDYPYVVKFTDGYQDYYAETDIQPTKDTVFIIYTTDGYNDQVVGGVFSTLEKAILYCAKQLNPKLSGDELQALALKNKDYFARHIHEFEVNPA